MFKQKSIQANVAPLSIRISVVVASIFFIAPSISFAQTFAGLKAGVNASHIKYEMLVSQSGHFTPTVKAVKTRKVFGALIYVKLIPSANVDTLGSSLQTKAEPILGEKHGPPLEYFNHKLQNIPFLTIFIKLVSRQRTNRITLFCTRKFN